MNKKLIVIIAFILVVSSGIGIGYTYAISKENIDDGEVKRAEIDKDNDDDKEKIVDNEAPILVLKNLNIDEGNTYTLNDFVEKCEDNIDKKCQLILKDNEMINYTTPGSYEIIIIAQDKSGNTTEAKTTLIINDVIETPDQETPNKKPETSNPKPKDETKPVKVKSTTETKYEDSYVYGVKVTKITVSYYDVYSDGSKIKTKDEISYKYDKNNYAASAADLRNEATKLYNQNKNDAEIVLNNANSDRQKVGVPNLKLDQELSIIANMRALEMAWSGIFEHVRPNGNSCFTILDEANYNYKNAGENIAYNYQRAVDVSQGWRESPDHYNNIIDPAFTKIGIGKAVIDNQIYWVQLFSD